MPIINGTTYSSGTPEGVIRVLENARVTRYRIAIFYGDPATGKVWGDVEVGTVGRSMGPERIPIILKTSRSSGGGGILTDNIIRIEKPSAPYRLLYRAPSAPETRHATMARVYKAWGREDLLPYMDEYGNVPARIRNAPKQEGT
jgi:hypothetical protein